MKGISYKSITPKDIYNSPDQTYLIKRTLPEKTICILGGPAGIAKSIVALSIIKSVLTGEPLWNKYKVLKTGPVLLVDEETPIALLKQRMQRMHFNDKLQLFCLHFKGVRLDNEGSFEALMSEIKRVKPVLVVFDSLTRIHRQSEAYANKMSLVMERLRKIGNWGTTVLVIHHHRKGNGDPSQMLRGSSDIAGGIDIEYALTRKKKTDKYLTFKSEKTRIKPLNPIKLKIIFRKHLIKVICKGKEASKDEKILSSVKKILGKENELGVEDIHLKLKVEKTKVGKNALRDMLKEGVNKKMLLVRIVGVNKHLYRVNPSFPVSRSYKESVKLGS